MNKTNLYNNICYANVVDPKFVWLNDPPLVKPLPKLVLQMAISIFVNHGLLLIFQFIRQPRIVADIITAITLSPSTLNHIHNNLGDFLFPSKSRSNMDTVAYFGLLYALFIRGLHMDLTPMTHKTVKTFTVACSLVMFPFTIGCASYLAFWLSNKKSHTTHDADVVTIYWGTVVTATSFPTLAPILSKHKLLCTDIGREVLSSGMMNDLFTWLLILCTLAISSSTPDSKHYVFAKSTACVLFAMALFILFCFFVIRPIISKLVGENPERQAYSDATLQAVLLLVLACGLVADVIGSHFLFGAFVLGMCIPHGVLTKTLIEKMEDCVLGVFMPLFFASVGTRLDIGTIVEDLKYVWLIAIGILAKPFCTMVTSLILKRSISNGVALGVLLNAKGLLPLVIIFVGHERGHLTEDAFTILLLIILFSTIMVGPVISLGYKRLRKLKHHHVEKTLEGLNPSDELRLVTCIHAAQNVPGIINLLELTNITTQTPATVSVLQLVEQVGQASAMFIEHTSQISSSSPSASDSVSKSNHFFNRMMTHSNKLISSFHEYERKHSLKSFIKTLTLVSPIETMHEDICSLANDKRATFIILPFHKQKGMDGKLEDINHSFQAVNQNVLLSSPCSVGILVDKGLRILPSNEPTRVAMVYIGGPDDREALTYAQRMASHTSATLMVIRFLLGDHAIEVQYNGVENNEQDGILSSFTRIERERQLDDEFIRKFRVMTVGDDSISYVEREVNNAEEAVSMLREMHCEYDLYVVGRGRVMSMPLGAGMMEWSDCPELGMIGDVLVTSTFACDSSVLVVQQHGDRVKNKVYDNYINDDDVQSHDV